MFEVTKNIQRLARELFIDEEEQVRFIQALAEGKSSEQAIIWLAEKQECFQKKKNVPWQADFIDCLESDQAAGSNSLHQAGKYYCLDFSSVFEAAVFNQVDNTPEAILDLCASPGGKSVLAWRYFKPQVLISNEVIGKRLGQLHSNIKRCGIPAIISNNDSADFAKYYELAFDLVIVDAPCTGQSLIAKGKKSPSCFHPATINLNFNRQKRIIANASSAVAPGAYLAYMTCAYSYKENEGVVEWFLKKFPEFVAVEVSSLKDFRSALTENPCYRLFPQQKMGAGGFCVLFKRETESLRKELDLRKLRRIKM